MSNELLQKVIDTSNVGAGGGGLLNPDQANTFIDYMWDETVLANEGRKQRMVSNTADVDKLGIGTRIARKATEAVDDGVNAAATFTKISLTTTKIRLDWELTTESLEDNIEGAALEDHIARLMATQLGNDLEDVGVSGDTTSSDALLKSFDGFRKLGLATGHVLDAGGATITKAVFNKALKTMPRKYLQRRNQLKFYTGSSLQQDYLYSLSTSTDAGIIPQDIVAGVLTGQTVARSGPAGTVIGYAFGLPVQEVPLYDTALSGTYSGASGDHGDVELTFPNNRVWGIKRDITVYRQFKPKKDAIEYTVYVRMGVQWENTDALVVTKNVKVSTS